MAYLHGNVLKNAWNTAPTVQDDGKERVALLLKVISHKLIFQFRFVPQFVCMQILVFVGVLRHEHSVLTTKESRVDDRDKRTRAVYLLWQFDRIKKLRDSASGDTGIGA